MSNAIELLPIKQLLEMKFFIPSYQRGYRWGKQEITDLLNDIYEYQNEANSQEQTTKVGMFYCLQPVVVKGRGDGSYENYTSYSKPKVATSCLTCALPKVSKYIAANNTSRH